jgi:hypothetical protein
MLEHPTPLVKDHPGRQDRTPANNGVNTKRGLPRSTRRTQRKREGWEEIKERFYGVE